MLLHPAENPDWLRYPANPPGPKSHHQPLASLRMQIRTGSPGPVEIVISLEIVIIRNSRFVNLIRRGDLDIFHILGHFNISAIKHLSLFLFGGVAKIVRKSLHVSDQD